MGMVYIYKLIYLLNMLKNHNCETAGNYSLDIDICNWSTAILDI